MLPYQASHGMVVVASFAGVENPDKHIWIRRFESEAERVRIYKEVYELAQ